MKTTKTTATSSKTTTTAKSSPVAGISLSSLTPEALAQLKAELAKARSTEKKAEKPAEAPKPRTLLTGFKIGDKVLCVIDREAWNERMQGHGVGEFADFSTKPFEVREGKVMGVGSEVYLVDIGYLLLNEYDENLPSDTFSSKQPKAAAKRCAELTEQDKAQSAEIEYKKALVVGVANTSKEQKLVAFLADAKRGQVVGVASQLGLNPFKDFAGLDAKAINASIVKAWKAARKARGAEMDAKRNAAAKIVGAWKAAHPVAEKAEQPVKKAAGTK